MIIESCISDHSLPLTYAPLTIGQYPFIDTLVFEYSDLIRRPVINWYTTDPVYFVLHLDFNNYTVEVRSPYKPVIRYVLQCILLDIDVYESDIQRHFPEYFL